MLAPRKTLWSTPLVALDHIVEWIPLLEPNDCVCDIGCGCGRLLLQWAQRYCEQQQQDQDQGHTSTTTTTTVKFIGIDIDPERIQQCQIALKQAQSQGKITCPVEFHCANALQCSTQRLFQEATIFFLYLIPRGLKLIHPLLMKHKEQQQQCRRNNNNVFPTTTSTSTSTSSSLRVVTYMAKFPCGDHTPVDRALLSVDHQPGAAWPLYFYKL